MKVLLIFNNFAGNKRAAQMLKEVQQQLHDKEIDYDLEIPSHPGNGTELVAEADLNMYDGVLAAGGDGTLYEVVNGLFQNPAEKKIPIGIIPVGTGNAFARDMDLHVDHWQKAIDIIKGAKTRNVDVGRFVTEDNTYYYLNILGLGFVADVGKTAHKLKIFGNLSYTLGVIYQTLFLKATPTKIITEDREFEVDSVFVEVSNSRYTANFLMAPFAELDDGLLDVTVAKPMSRIKLLRSFPLILTGEHIELEEVMHFTCKRIDIQCSKAKILTPDGELMGSTPVNIECLREKVAVFWP